MGRRKNFLEDFATDSESSGSDDELELPSAPGHEDDADVPHRRKRRRTGRDAKEAAALGVFGSESEDERPGRGKWKAKDLRNKNVAFVAQGQKVQSEDDDEDADMGVGFAGFRGTKDEEAEEEEERPRLGLGGGLGYGGEEPEEAEEQEEERPRLGLGGHSFSKFTKAAGNSAATSGTSTPRSLDAHTGLGFSQGTTDTPLGRGFVSSAAASRAQMPSFAPAPASATPPPVARPSFFTPASTNGKGANRKGGGDASAGTPAANPDSFAARMMAKMGYVQGKGLGKSGEGRLTPVETKLRPQGAGLGAVREKTEQEKKEARRAAELRGEVLSDSEDERKAKKKAAAAARRKKGGLLAGFDDSPGASPRTPGRQKPRFRTAEEMAAGARGLEVPSTLKNLIDLTGKEAKLLTTSAGAMARQPQAPPGADVEGMKIAKMARRDLESFTGEWRGLQERKAFLESEEVRLARELDAQAEDHRKLQGLVDVVKGLRELSVGGGGADGAQEAAEAVVAQLEVLQFKFASSLEEQRMADIAVGALHPLFKTHLASWSPLDDPFSPFLEHFRRLHAILGIRSKTDLEAEYAAQGYLSRSAAKLTTPYESLLHTLWLPKVRAAINNDWNVHNPTPVLTLLDAWQPVLPPFVQATILDQLVLPKLRAAVADWNPRLQNKKPPHAASRHRRRVPPAPHLWVFPWLPYLGAHMSELLRDMRTKFGTVLAGWDAAGAGDADAAALGLDAWRDVFGAEALEALLVRHVLPQLAAHLHARLAVDPADQDLAPLEAVLRWAPFFAPATLARLLHAELFPKFLATLHAWLTSPAVDLAEVRQWYVFWQDVLPAALRAHPLVQARFRAALDMINAALDLGPARVAAELPAPAAGPVPLAEKKRRDAPPAAAAAPPAPATTRPADLAETTFRDVVQEWCEEHDLVLVPLRKAEEASGRPLFRVSASASGAGGVLVYLKGDVVWAMERKSRKFAPVGLEEILARLEGR